MEWLIPSIIAAAVGTLLLALVYFYLYVADRKSYLAIWGVSWAVYFLRFAFMLGLETLPDCNTCLIGNQMASLVSGVLLLWGTYRFVGKKEPGAWMFCAGMAALWVVIGVVWEFGFFRTTVPTFAFLAMVYIRTGVAFLKSHVVNGYSRQLTGFGFIFWGIHKINYPFFRPVAWLAPWGYLLGTVFEFTVILGMLFAYFQKIRQELKHEQLFLEKAQEIGQIGSWELDIRQNRLVWSDENYKIFELPPGTGLTYEVFLSCVHPEDRAYVDQTWKAAFDHKPYDIEHRLLVNGKTKWVREKAELMFDEKGRCIKGTGVTQDITGRKLVQASLEESEKKFRLIFQTSLDAVYLTRLEDGRYIDINEGFTQIMGYTRKDTVEGRVVDGDIWQNARDRERFVQDVRRYGYVKNMEAEFTAKNQDIKNGLISARVLEIGGEKVIVSITRDYTDRKKAEQALAGSEAWHRSILETAMDGFCLTDISGKIIEVNKTYCRMTGYAEDELLKMGITDLEFKENEDHITRRISRIMEKKEDLFESRHVKKDGTLIEVEVSVQFREHMGGCLVIFIKDITERKHWHEQLQKAQKMESIGSLAGGIAHDFNNILFPIIGMSELLMEDLQKDSFEYDNAREIYLAGKRAGDLVNQILAFSRQSDHKMMPVKFQKIMKEVMKLCRSTIPSSIDIRQDIQNDCGFVWANGTRLHQVAMNLMTNAYHAVEDNNGFICVSLKEISVDGSSKTGLKEGRYVNLCVSDNGTGIDQEIIDKIFDPYFTTKGQGKGTGLGLAVTYGIVKDHNGEIRVQSRAGHGSTFDVYLPRMADSSGDDKAASGEPPLEGGSEHILLVDDEPAIGKLSGRILHRLGYSVTFRHSSTEALALFKSAPDKFDLVLSDMSMPGMTGDRLAGEIRKIRPFIPVIICTGFSEKINKDKAKDIGVNGFLPKPIVKSDMALMLRTVLDKAKAHPCPDENT